VGGSIRVFCGSIKVRFCGSIKVLFCGSIKVLFCGSIQLVFFGIVSESLSVQALFVPFVFFVPFVVKEVARCVRDYS
jgi:hypothetical protein